MAINDSCVLMVVGYGAISNDDLTKPINTKNNLSANNIGDNIYNEFNLYLLININTMNPMPKFLKVFF